MDDLFEKVNIRIGKVLNVEIHPNADSMYVEKIDLGEDEPRTIVSGLRNHISVSDFKGKWVLVVCNLKPRKLRGILSSGMVLCASNEDHSVVELLRPKLTEGEPQHGDRVIFDGFESEETPPAKLNPKKKWWEKVAEHLKTDDDRFATYKGKKLCSVAGNLIECDSLSNSLIG